jgi:hypothetical protein
MQMIPGDTSGAFFYILVLVLIWIIFIELFHYFRPRAAEKRWFLQHGKRVTATIEKIEQGKLSGVQPWVPITDYYSVYARWRDQKGRVHIVESDGVPLAYLHKSTNPALSRDIVAGERIQVLVDPNDPEHAMIADLPPKMYRKAPITNF